MGRGFGFLLSKLVEQLCSLKGYYSVRVAAQPENKKVIRGLLLNGYQHCGDVEVSGRKILIFEKVILQRPTL